MKIQIDVNSWHFRMLGWIYGINNIPKNLCPYFWMTLTTVALFPTILFAKYMIEMTEKLIDKAISLEIKHLGTFMGILGISIIGILSIYGLFIGAGLAEAVSIACIGLGLGGAFGISILHQYCNKRFGKPKFSGANLIIEMAKAKKSKYCPMIDFVNSADFKTQITIDQSLRSVGLVPCPKGCGNYTYQSVDKCTKCLVKEFKQKRMIEESEDTR